MVGLYLLYFIVQYPVVIRVLGKHSLYESPHFYIVAVITSYFTSTSISSLFSSNKAIRLFGALAVVTFHAAYAIHVATLISVWCFFAALLSFIVYFYFRQQRAESRRAMHTTLRAIFGGADAP